uniref:Tumor necrosis factor alpha-induced protein 8-like protein 2 n=1 Tax=Steinernema glaseri TaxID=37863 RepID=A0A1I7YSP9_9BILA
MTSEKKRVLQESNSLSSGSDGNGSCSNAGFSSASLFERIQKNVVGKVGKRSVMKHFVSGNSSRLFDNLYTILKERYPKNVAEKIISNIIKISLKLGVVTRENKLSEQLLDDLHSFQRCLKTLLLTVSSYGTLDFSYDYKYLKGLMDNVQIRLTHLTSELLSDKSVKRVGHIFHHLGDADFLDSALRTGAPNNALMKTICEDLDTLMENKSL